MVRSNLVKRALSVATEAQLISIRVLLGRGWGLHGTDRIESALTAFDNKQYDHPDILYLLSDKDIGETLR
ncbi:MAG: hypothetical protein Q7K26_02635 [bacterium]|nr:hypothetical protein [bacterium]